MEDPYPSLYVKSGPYGLAVEEIRLNDVDMLRFVKSLSFDVGPNELSTVTLTFHANVELNGSVGEVLAVHPGCRFDPDEWSWEVDSRCGLPHYAEMSA